MLSGYETQTEYEQRNAGWDGDKTYQSYETALEAAQTWLSGRSEHAQVEITAMSGNDANVIAVATQTGVEQI